MSLLTSGLKVVSGRLVAEGDVRPGARAVVAVHVPCRRRVQIRGPHTFHIQFLHEGRGRRPQRAADSKQPYNHGHQHAYLLQTTIHGFYIGAPPFNIATGRFSTVAAHNGLGAPPFQWQFLAFWQHAESIRGTCVLYCTVFHLTVTGFCFLQ